MKRWVLAVALIAAASHRGFAQFYAPKTDYHDPVQRMFVVEAARVLAWWTDPTGSRISEVTYDLTTKPDRTTVWSIRCWNPAHEPVKEAVVLYPPELLKSGPEFYRSVLKQLWQSEWKPVPSIEGTDAAAAFWRGAARCGVAREDNLLSAIRLVASLDKKKPGPTSGDWMPELAGILAHTTLASRGESVTLDRVVLARAAAWLALTEQAASTKAEPLWAPILFQAGRYQAAGKAWQSFALPEKPLPQQEGWNVWLRNPNSRDIFRFAATPTNFAMAMPMLAWDVKVNGTGPALVALLEELAGGRARLQNLHNYAPFFVQDTTVRGGMYLEGLWPLYERIAWLRLLAAYPARTNEYRAYLGPLRTATNALTGQPMTLREIDNSLKALNEAFPLLHLAQQEGVGKLAPTPVVTTRDLLNYGWETTGWQLGARYAVLRAGAPDAARKLHQAVFPELEGLVPFFVAYPHSGTSDYYVNFERLQCIEGLTGLVGFTPAAREGNEKEGEAGPRLARRCWLRCGDLPRLARALWDDGALDDLQAMLKEFREQGGALAAANILHYLSELNEEEFQKLSGARDLQLKLGESLPEPSLTQADALFHEKFRVLEPFARAQAYERLFWENPDSGLERSVVFNYIISGRFKAAKRFYTQARVYFTDPVRVSNYAGRQIYLMAWCQDDVALRKQALKDSECGSRADLTMRIWEAALTGDTNRIEKTALEFAERYEAGFGKFGMASRLLKFLPLLPGLRAKDDPLREDALDFWEGDPRWLILGFLWVDKYGLEKQEVERVLGREPEGSFRGMMLRGLEGENIFRDFLLSYLNKNPAKALQDFNELLSAGNPRTEEIVLAACLYNRMEPLAPPHDEPDLKPAEVVSLKQVVQERKRGKTQKAAGAL